MKRFFYGMVIVNKTRALWITLGIGASVNSSLAAEVTVTIDFTKSARAISPWIYGTNFSLEKEDGVAFRRSGGNRLTAYNWENNASNAGADWYHSSDSYLSTSNAPGKTLMDFHDETLLSGAASLVTLQAAGYVARDKSGNVEENEIAPSPRWVPVQFRKGSAFTLTPSTSDDAVYMDEAVNFLVQKYGKAGTATGVSAYSLDNEPSLWSHTHARLHPENPSCAEIVRRNADLAAAIKSVDENALTFGGVFFGYSAFQNFLDAPDWDALEASDKYGWFLDYFLEQMRLEGEKSGHRLLDVLDLHWYSEAQGDVRITEANAKSAADQVARLQSPRSFWDTTYAETSWISQWITPKQPVVNWDNPEHGPIHFIPHVQASIDAHYPGTKIAFTEWNFGGQDDITGGLAVVDVLGVFARQGVFAAAYWPLNDELDYVRAAFRLFRNADGKGLAAGSAYAMTRVSDNEKISAHATFEPGSTRMHLLVINKELETNTVKLALTGATVSAAALAFGFDGSSTDLTSATPMTESGGIWQAEIPARSARHYVLEMESNLPGTWIASPNRRKSIHNILSTDTRIPLLRKSTRTGLRSDFWKPDGRKVR
jgi:mannan endo-1,4-beta-mannosidase